MRPYTTIAEETVAERVIKHSRFIATALPIEDYEDGLEKIAAIKARYPDATHNCYAMIADEQLLRLKVSDDGEPQGTAGLPILEVIKRKEICRVAVVVTRYFGGIKLGANGLIGAYAGTASDVLDVAKLVHWVPSVLCRVAMDFYVGGKLTDRVNKAGGVVLDTEYTDCVRAHVAVPVERYEGLKNDLVQLTRGKVVIDEVREAYHAY